MERRRPGARSRAHGTISPPGSAPSTCCHCLGESPRWCTSASRPMRRPVRVDWAMLELNCGSSAAWRHENILYLQVKHRDSKLWFCDHPCNGPTVTRASWPLFRCSRARFIFCRSCIPLRLDAPLRHDPITNILYFIFLTRPRCILVEATQFLLAPARPLSSRDARLRPRPRPPKRAVTVCFDHLTSPRSHLEIFAPPGVSIHIRRWSPYLPRRLVPLSLRLHHEPRPQHQSYRLWRGSACSRPRTRSASTGTTSSTSPEPAAHTATSVL